MNFSEVVDEVVRITKRPDKILDTRREVNAAINFCCADSDFARDRVEDTFEIESDAYAGNIALSEFTRFRKIDAIRPSGRNKLLDFLEPNRIFNGGRESTDVYYIAGTQLNYKLCALDSELIIAYYSYPAVLTGTQTFWLLDVSPFMIIDKAAAQIFTNIGEANDARYHKDCFKEAYLAARKNYQHSANPR
jgi:hypothetical protein